MVISEEWDKVGGGTDKEDTVYLFYYYNPNVNIMKDGRTVGSYSVNGSYEDDAIEFTMSSWAGTLKTKKKIRAYYGFSAVSDTRWFSIAEFNVGDYVYNSVRNIYERLPTFIHVLPE